MLGSSFSCGNWGHLGSSFSWVGEDIWVAVLAGWVRIVGWQF